MDVLYVCLIWMPYMYMSYMDALYVCAETPVHMNDMIQKTHIKETCCMSHGCLICMSYMDALYVYVLYGCLICMCRNTCAYE